MGLCGPLREVTDFVEKIERGAGEVTGVDFPDRLTRETPLATEVAVRLPVGSTDGDGGSLSVRCADLESDGSLRLGLETGEPVVPSTAPTVESEIRETSIHPEGGITVVLAVSVSTDDGSSASVGSVRSDRDSHRDEGPTDSDGTYTDSHGAPTDSDETHTDSDDSYSDSSASDRDVPPFRDRELLAEVYDSCETFAEMSDALDMDVTAETVRRYMIEHGIHEAATYDTAGGDRDASDPEASEVETDTATTVQTESAGEGETGRSSDQPSPAETGRGERPVVRADGIGLSEDIDVDTLIEAVRNSRTIYEVKQEIGVEREDAVETLRECNLLDLVVGRLSEDGTNEVTREEIVDRLRAKTAP